MSARFIFLLKSKSKFSSAAIWDRGSGQFVPAREKSIFTPTQLVRDERRDEIERGQPFGLSVAQPRLEDIGHAGEPEFTKRTIELDERHSEPHVFWSMRSR